MKRLIVACDGTWLDSDDGFYRNSWLPWKTGGYLATSSNVTRICRALHTRSEDGIEQIVYYQAGVGTANNWYSFFLGGYLGEGISENIREAYAFLCSNYEDGDEITLIGFSRGAFTARSVGGLIGDVGLLTDKGLNSFYDIYTDWQNQENPNYKPQFGTPAWPKTRPKFSDPTYLPELVEAGLTRPSIPVKSTAVWDTVGVLGVPLIKVFGITLYNPAHKQYSFIDTKVPSNVEYAYQALALDEERKPYAPTLWESPKPGSPSRLKELKQCWFPGVHVNIGGGTPDTSISSITLAWMISQLSKHLSFKPDYILGQRIQNVDYYKENNLPVATWAMGAIVQDDTGLLNDILGRQVRTPGDYYATDPATGKPTDQRLVETHEFMHPSVHYRIAEHGPGLVKSATSPPRGSYEPKALKGWRYFAPGEPVGDVKIDSMDGTRSWKDNGKWTVRRSDGTTTLIVEEKILPQSDEMELLQAWGAAITAKVLAS